MIFSIIAIIITVGGIVMYLLSSMIIGTIMIAVGLLSGIGLLNIISSLNEINYSKTVLEKPSGIVQKFEPIAGSVIILIYNLVIGGIIGVIGSIYYFIAIRSFVMENKEYFASLDM